MRLTESQPLCSPHTWRSTNDFGCQPCGKSELMKQLMAQLLNVCNSPNACCMILQSGFLSCDDFELSDPQRIPDDCDTMDCHISSALYASLTYTLRWVRTSNVAIDVLPAWPGGTLAAVPVFNGSMLQNFSGQPHFSCEHGLGQHFFDDESWSLGQQRHIRRDSDRSWFDRMCRPRFNRPGNRSFDLGCHPRVRGVHDRGDDDQ